MGPCFHFALSPGSYVVSPGCSFYALLADTISFCEESVNRVFQDFQHVALFQIEEAPYKLPV